MKAIIVKLTFVVFVISIYTQLCFLNDVFAEGEGQATIELSGTDMQGAPIRASIYIDDFPKECPLHEGWRWGTEKLPNKIIRKIDIRLGENKLYIPISAFFDLANPRKATLSKTASGFELQITGGDAATSYRANLQFDNGSIRFRRVTHGEFSEEAWEETKYSFNW